MEGRYCRGTENGAANASSHLYYTRPSILDVTSAFSSHSDALMDHRSIKNLFMPIPILMYHQIAEPAGSGRPFRSPTGLRKTPESCIRCRLVCALELHFEPGCAIEAVAVAEIRQAGVDGNLTVDRIFVIIPVIAAASADTAPGPVILAGKVNA